MDEVVIEEQAIVLPHQCDHWVIGGVDEARLLIRDLERLISEGPPCG